MADPRNPWANARPARIGVMPQRPQQPPPIDPRTLAFAAQMFAQQNRPKPQQVLPQQTPMQRPDDGVLLDVPGLAQRLVGAIGGNPELGQRMLGAVANPWRSFNQLGEEAAPFGGQIAGALGFGATPKARGVPGARPAQQQTPVSGPAPTQVMPATPAGDDSYNTVLGYGAFGKPPGPLTDMSLGGVIDFGRNVLIPNSKKAGVGKDERGTLGSSAVGRYQFTQETLGRLAPKVLGENWREQKFTPEVQDRLAEQLFNESKGGNLKKIWAGLPNAAEGAYAGVPWEQMKHIIAKHEGTAGRGNNAAGPAGGGASPFGGVGGVDPSLWGPQLGAIDASAAAAKTPWSTTVQMPEAPAFPDAPEMPKRDFSKTDALLEEMRPVLDIEKDQKRITRANLFAGMAKGLAASGENPSVGALLANVGAGMLAGRAAADMEMQKRIDVFDEKMAQYKLLSFKYEDEKSSQVYNEALKEVSVMYEHNTKKWAADMDQFNQNWSVQATPNGVLATSKVAGGRTITYTPNSQFIEATRQSQRANVFGAVAGEQADSAQAEAAATRQLMLSGLLQKGAEGEGDEQMLSRMFASTEVVASELVDSGILAASDNKAIQERYRQSAEKAQKAVQARGIPQGSEEYATATRQIIVADLANGLIEDPGARQMFMSPEMTKRLQQSYMARRLLEQQRTRKTTPKGTTDTVRY